MPKTAVTCTSTKATTRPKIRSPCFLGGPYQQNVETERYSADDAVGATGVMSLPTPGLLMTKLGAKRAFVNVAWI